MKVVLTNKNYLGQYIGFIKAIRSAFDVSLKDAKHISDQFKVHPAFSGDEFHKEQEIEIDFAKFSGVKVKVNQDYKQIVVGECIDQQFISLAKNCLDLGMYTQAQQLIEIIRIQKEGL